MPERLIQTHKIDADGRILGRLATEIAILLRGKNKPGFQYHLDLGDRVIVENAERIQVTGRKASQKMYYRHSGYPGGLKSQTYQELKESDPAKLLYLAVRGMLPDNKLRNRFLKRLEIRHG